MLHSTTTALVPYSLPILDSRIFGFIKFSIDSAWRYIYVPVSFHPQEGVSRSSRNAGWNAVAATASGATSNAGRLAFNGAL
jgi:hypothetical protein